MEINNSIIQSNRAEEKIKDKIVPNNETTKGNRYIKVQFARGVANRIIIIQIEPFLCHCVSVIITRIHTVRALRDLIGRAA